MPKKIRRQGDKPRTRGKQTNTTSEVLNRLCVETQKGINDYRFQRAFLDTQLPTNRAVHDGLIYILPKGWKPTSSAKARE